MQLKTPMSKQKLQYTTLFVHLAQGSYLSSNMQKLDWILFIRSDMSWNIYS
jgi:hypothetical protein